MTLPVSGPITLLEVATELGRSDTIVTFNQDDVLSLVGKTTGQTVILPDDFWGKTKSP